MKNLYFNPRSTIGRTGVRAVMFESNLLIFNKAVEEIWLFLLGRCYLAAISNLVHPIFSKHKHARVLTLSIVLPVKLLGELCKYPHFVDWLWPFKQEKPKANMQRGVSLHI